MAAPSCTLRRADPADVPALVDLVNTAYGRTEEEAGWTSEEGLIAGPRIEEDGVRELVEAPGSVLLVTEEAGELVGCVHLEKGHGDDCELGLLSIAPQAQDRGLGRWLLAQAEAHAWEHLEAARIVMHVVSVREALIAWYERRGYTSTGKREPFEPFGGQRFLQGPLAFEVLVKELAQASG